VDQVGRVGVVAAQPAGDAEQHRLVLAHGLRERTLCGLGRRRTLTVPRRSDHDHRCAQLHLALRTPACFDLPDIFICRAKAWDFVSPIRHAREMPAWLRCDRRTVAEPVSTRDHAADRSEWRVDA
jgi:hypothetical protein